MLRTTIALMSAFSFSEILAQEGPLPAAPDSLIEFSWSSKFAIVIAEECANFVLDSGDSSRVFAFLDKIVEEGIELENYDTFYAPVPEFNGDSVKHLFAISDLAEVISPPDETFCELAELVYSSDMLTAAMLRRPEPLEGS